MASGRTAWLAEQEMRNSHRLPTDSRYPPDTLEAGLFRLGAEASGFSYSRRSIANGAAAFRWSDAASCLQLAASLSVAGPIGGNWGLIDELRLFVPLNGPEYERYRIVDAAGNPTPIQTAADKPVVFPEGTGLQRLPIDLPV